MFKQYSIKNYDFKLIFLIIMINTLGILIVNSANSSLTHKQLLGSVMGFLLMLVVSFFDHKVILKFYWLWYIINLVLLLAVQFAGSSSHNAQRWFEIGGIRFQPSETAKILLIIFFAQFIMRYREKINTITFIVSYIVLAGIPLYFIVKQPDLSTTMVIAIVIIAILFVGGISWKIVIPAIALAIPSIIVFFSIILKDGQTLLEKYQRNRILSFIYPEKYVDNAYQQTNSVIAIGSGQLSGKGLNNNLITSLKNGDYIPEPETDFIFAVIGEELGFIGSVTVVVLLFLIVFECLDIARKCKDKDGRVIATGMATLIGVHTFFNIGVATFILPNTGLTLPFVSYGLTSLVSFYIGLGFVLNVKLKSGVTKERNKQETFSID